uniref:Proteasome maturation protein n=1 Tax=Accipiter nisus TaxID=211598 RepID=A0A8B9RPC0_9AVES
PRLRPSLRGPAPGAGWRRSLLASDAARRGRGGSEEEEEAEVAVRVGSRCFTSVKNELLPSHPLELAEKNFQLNQDKTNFATLRNIQGLHAPLKLQMEFRAVKQAQRLPFLHSSNIALDTLRGNDECIGFEDILNDPSQSEVMGEPHMMMEYKLGLL